MKRMFLAGAIAASALTAQVMAGHHGGAAYDQTKSVTFEGTVTEMQFANPHVLVYWDVKSGDQAGQKWSGWLTAPTKLARAGWTRKTLNPGDHIVVTGTPHKDGSHVLQIRNLVGPEGNPLPLSENQ
jgi:hydrogenase maturation factor